jgi:hypothetical protein
MNRKLALTADFLDCLSNLSHGPDINDARALLLAMAEGQNVTGDFFIRAIEPPVTRRRRRRSGIVGLDERGAFNRLSGPHGSCP